MLLKCKSKRNLLCKIKDIFLKPDLVFSFAPLGVHWLSGRVLNSRPKGRGFEPHGRHCAVVFEQDPFILA